MNLYNDKEIQINPDFQRLFRWDESRKTRFIESLLLGIPIPPIFVYQNEDGVWELIDGLQRLSTVFEFAGTLRKPEDERNKFEPSVLEGTKYLPSLANKKWKSSRGNNDDGIGREQQLQIKRARIRVEILKSESDPKAKYELFQRLNTGGARLSEQEVRNCVAVMVNKEFYDWLQECSQFAGFQTTIDQTDYAIEKQMDMELALRFFVFRNVPYEGRLDVHEYLDDAMVTLASGDFFEKKSASEKKRFERIFTLLNDSMGDKAFKRWDGNRFLGKFLMSVFEVVATGVAKNLSKIEKLPDPREYIKQRCIALWNDATFMNNSGAGIRGTTRLTNLLPMAESFFAP